MARIVRQINIWLDTGDKPALAQIRGYTLDIGMSPEKYVKFARWVQADLDRRFPWHKHPLYQWARRKCGEGEK